MESRIELGGSRTFSIENVLVPPTPILLSDPQTLNLIYIHNIFNPVLITLQRSRLFGFVVELL